jgi:hypothetical protein
MSGPSTTCSMSCSRPRWEQQQHQTAAAAAAPVCVLLKAATIIRITTAKHDISMSSSGRLHMAPNLQPANSLVQAARSHTPSFWSQSAHTNLLGDGSPRAMPFPHCHHPVLPSSHMPCPTHVSDVLPGNRWCPGCSCWRRMCQLSRHRFEHKHASCIPWPTCSRLLLSAHLTPAGVSHCVHMATSS